MGTRHTVAEEDTHHVDAQYLHHVATIHRPHVDTPTIKIFLN